ncbi:MAG: glycosyltransferase family 39 protein [Caldilineaceae bacterium]
MIERESWPQRAVNVDPIGVEVWKPQRPLLLVAIFGALVIHGGLALYGSYANTYDAYIHMFFADHWLKSWFDHWDPRWYTGFTMTSYPPLSHQSVALLSKLTGDLRTAFVLVQTIAMALLTLGMYRFAKLWVDDEAAQWAAIWLVLSSGVAETVHVFGQLPTIVSLGFLLNALPYIYDWVNGGHKRNLWRGLALVGATTGAHHVTTLFGAVFIMAPVVLLGLLQHLHTPLLDELTTGTIYWTKRTWRAFVVRYLRRVLAPGLRTVIFGIGAVTLLLIIVWPYWAWSRFDPISQVPIPHASRDNFLINLNAGLIFWIIPYGMLILLMPYLFVKGFAGRTWPLTASFAFMALLGTGGTTPIPKLLLQGAFDILTLDRFTLWAAILMLPLAGRFTTSLNRGAVGRWLQVQFGYITWHSVQLTLVAGVVAFFVFTVSLPQFRKFQPAPIDMQPIVNFLNKDQHWRWRFLTLGFGDQMAWLSTQTQALQVDGNYHSARRLPEMTTTSVERLEGAKFGDSRHWLIAAISQCAGKVQSKICLFQRQFLRSTALFLWLASDRPLRK